MKKIFLAAIVAMMPFALVAKKMPKQEMVMPAFLQPGDTIAII